MNPAFISVPGHHSGPRPDGQRFDSAGHQTNRSPAGALGIAPGWGPAKGIVFSGNRFIGRHENRPEDSVPPPDTAPRPIVFEDWPGPQFDPRRPDTFEAYLKAHREWMVRLMERQFGRNP